MTSAKAGEFANFLERIRKKSLAAESWIYRHDQNLIHFVKNIRERRDRRRGIDYHSRAASVFADHRDRAIEMNGSFLVYKQRVGSGFGKGFHKLLWVFDHEMHV